MRFAGWIWLLTQGSPTLTFTSGYTASAADVGKYIEMVYEVSGVLPASMRRLRDLRIVTRSRSRPTRPSRCRNITVDVGTATMPPSPRRLAVQLISGRSSFPSAIAGPTRLPCGVRASMD